MAKQMQKTSMFIEQSPGDYENGDIQKNLDDDGRPKRTGTWVTASAHIITAVIGSGVLSLAWAIAQLGWVAGPAVLMAFSFITYFTSTLLADCYRAPDPVHGKRNYTYMDVVRAYLGGRKVQLCGLAQYANLVGITIGYTITASISMLSWLSIVAAIMSFAYSSIGLGLSIAKVAGGEHVRTSLTGVTVGVDVSGSEKVWRTFQAIGDIAFAYAYSTDTIKSSPPENKSMKRASSIGVSTTTLFYVLCGLIGYAAFGNDAPGNFLTGFGFYEPFWLIDFANICIAIHLIGAYQVFAQPLFGFVEGWCSRNWPNSKFITSEHAVDVPFYGIYYLNFFRLVWRTAYVIITAVVAMIFPFFNDFLGLIGAGSFWPLTVYFPIEMHIAQSKTPKYSFRWIWLKILSWVCLVVSLIAAAGSVQGLIQSLKTYKPFQTQE
ncbi:Amino acid permease 6 -like protein [Gossypium arboreum]|uniref:Amino acid permease 6-like protein n=1 Tax=Gossypium arboreum TaxID=29729 RepID=A0A0B0PNR0_GOSAR|nr:Amino acid permease 6 -like protein [Gossypium arboreum]KHG26079.1 Amino acid permease 6 -like protein [Gossypium arboreum]